MTCTLKETRRWTFYIFTKFHSLPRKDVWWNGDRAESREFRAKIKKMNTQKMITKEKKSKSHSVRSQAVFHEEFQENVIRYRSSSSKIVFFFIAVAQIAAMVGVFKVESKICRAIPFVAFSSSCSYFALRSRSGYTAGSRYAVYYEDI